VFESLRRERYLLSSIMANMYSDDEYYDNKYSSGYGHTGDPTMDRMEYTVPDQVKKFLQYFQDMIKEGNVYEVNNLYENSFPKLTEQFFKTSPWPEAEDIAGYVADDPIFLNLYRELYFRHIYARVQGGPTVEQRFETYYNYCKLFNYILSADTPVNLELPNQWLWEIIDEFIYQFQAFSQFRSNLSKKTEEEIEILKRNPKV
jgi:translation initiation factor 3 subunit L